MGSFRPGAGNQHLHWYFNYHYSGLPVVDERGMALLVKNKADLEQFLQEAKEVTAENRSELHNKWFRFETYRKIVCTDNFWVI